MSRIHQREYPTTGAEQLSVQLNRSISAIERKAEKLRLVRAPEFYLDRPGMRWRALPKDMQEVFLLTKKLERKLNEREQHADAA